MGRTNYERRITDHNQMVRIHRLELEENQTKDLPTIQQQVIASIISPIITLANSAPFTTSFVVRTKPEEKVIRIPRSETMFREYDPVLVIKLNNLDLNHKLFAPFFKSKITQDLRIYVPRRYHDQYQFGDKVLIVKTTKFHID